MWPLRARLSTGALRKLPRRKARRVQPQRARDLSELRRAANGGDGRALSRGSAAETTDAPVGAVAAVCVALPAREGSRGAHARARDRVSGDRGHILEKARLTHATGETGAVTLIQRFGSALNLLRSRWFGCGKSTALRSRDGIWSARQLRLAAWRSSFGASGARRPPAEMSGGRQCALSGAVRKQV